MATTKAALYIQQLDEARCAADWARVPELIRKVKKHAPHRICLTQTAQSELAVIEGSHHRPSTSARTSGLSKLIEPLSESIATENRYPEDEFQAKICLGWIHWILGDPDAALSCLPKDIEAEFSAFDGTDRKSAGWTLVSAMKAAYIKSAGQLLRGPPNEAYQTCESILPILASLPRASLMGEELKRWTELYLTGFCLLSARRLRERTTPTTEAEVLTAFRQWSVFWEGASIAELGGQLPAAPVQRREVWKEYYSSLSKIIQEHLPYPTTSLSVHFTSSSSKIQLHGELRRVETICEGLLLRAFSFPNAEESREEVEEWTDYVMKNWRVLCGNSWAESELEGGKSVASQKVLGLLYSAATKTFHSTSILRHLFTVHLAVAEFDLAFKAFDTYLEIVTRSKARVDKSGEKDPALDDDETVLLTATECIKALCKYGSSKGAEKAWELGTLFEKWLDKYDPSRSAGDAHSNGNGTTTSSLARVAPKVIAKTWQAIGISRANWARVSFDASTRAEFRAQAVNSFRKALAPHLESTRDLETLFPLALVLAEQRDVNAAIDVAKAALLPGNAAQTDKTLIAQSLWTRERALIPIWHLLALLVSARHEFAVATRSCEGAFEQFKDAKTLFGDTTSGFQSDHLKNVSEKTSAQCVIDLMDDHEKEAILEIKITQLVLAEVNDGPELAVNSSDELLELYSRLFGDPVKSLPQNHQQVAKPLAPPKSSAGTIRSLRGSIFGRSGKPTRKVSKRSTGNTVSERSSSTRPQTRSSVARTITPAIHVTGANGDTETPAGSQKRHGSLSLRGKSSTPSNGRSHGTETTEAITAESPLVAGEKEVLKEIAESPLSRSQVGLAISPENGDAVSANGAAAEISAGISDLPLDAQEQHVFNAWERPLPQFSTVHQRRRRVGVLIRVWLLIAGFYRRAQVFDDANGALQAAQELVEGLEIDVSKEASNLDALRDSGWGGGESVEELWADVHAAQGYLELEQGDKYKAIQSFETALVHWPDHSSATIGLSNLLLDIYTEVLLPPPDLPSLVLPKPLPGSSVPILSSETSLSKHNSSKQVGSATEAFAHLPQPLGVPRTDESNNVPNTTLNTPVPKPTTPGKSAASDPSPSLLGRLAARDRAFGLLSRLTKLGTGWNNSEAWFALARAYEESGQLDKAREALWWCVELEDNRGVRPWGCVGAGGYVL